MYPMALDYVAKQTNGNYGVIGGSVPVQMLDETVEELQARTMNHNRFCVNKSNVPQYKLLVNCSLEKGMLPPVCDDGDIQKLARQLEAKL